MQSPDGVTGPINLGNAEELTMLELARHIIDLTGTRSTIVFKPLPADDPRQRKPNVGAARSALGWEPATPLRDGLTRTIAYFEGLLRSRRVQDVVSEPVFDAT